ncbi:hypothetical protein MYFR107205_12320 [Mycolicibacterium frederiksbergense]
MACDGSCPATCCGPTGGVPVVGVLAGAPMLLAIVLALAVTVAEFCDSPSMIRLCTSAWVLLTGIDWIAMHSAWVSWATIFAIVLVWMTAASMVRSLAAMAAA